MAKADLGTKRLCPSCGARYYDLNHSPIICPRCGTQFEVPVAAGAGTPEQLNLHTPQPELSGKRLLLVEPNATSRRSARRQIARARSSAADPGAPPGRTN